MTKIVVAPSAVLSKKAKPIEKVDKNILRVIKQMEEALDSARDPQGVGIAAPQIGKSLNIFIVKVSPKSKLKVFMNPVIIEKSEDIVDEPAETIPEVRGKRPQKLEGCLSLPNIWGTVLRADKIKLSYLDKAGKQHTKSYQGFLATIVQHEVDHLQGILFPKRVLQQKGKLFKSHKDEKGEDIFEELKI